MKKTFTFFANTAILAGLLCLSLVSSAQKTSPKQNSLTTRFGMSTEIMTTPEIQNYRDGEVTVTTLLGSFEFPYGMSLNKNYAVIASSSGPEGWRWSSNGQLDAIDGYVYDVTNGGMVCGYYINPEGISVGGYWQDGAWNFLGMNPNCPTFTGTDYNSIWCMTSDGSIMAGMQFDEAWNAFPFTWTLMGGYEYLPIASGTSGRPNSISDDGSIIGGWSSNDFGSWLPTLWIEREQTLLSNEIGGEVNGVSRNGQYATGYAESDGTNAFVWSESNGFQIISNTIFSGMDASAAGVCVSDNGKIFGYANNSWPPFPDTRVAITTNENGEMITFQEYAISRGWAEAANWTFCQITDVSPDENTFLGSGFNPNGEGTCFMISFGSEAQLYNLNLIPNNEEAGVVIGAGQYEAGATVSISAIASEGNIFETWEEEDGTIVSTTADYEFTMPANDYTLYANFSPSVGISESKELNTSIFPIPASNSLNIKASRNADMQIIDLQGRVVMSKEVTSGINQIDVTNLPEGFYFIQFNNNGRQSISKISIVK